MTINATFKNMMQADLAAMLSDWSETLTHLKTGQEVEGTFSPVGTNRDVDSDGILESVDAEFVSDVDEWTTKPVTGDTVKINNVHYYITSMTEDPAAITLQLKRN
jgi:hypothetical protein